MNMKMLAAFGAGTVVGTAFGATLVIYGTLMAIGKYSSAQAVAKDVVSSGTEMVLFPKDGPPRREYIPRPGSHRPPTQSMN